jgi:Mn2+/Fe2+ NRAMP family transporter
LLRFTSRADLMGRLANGRAARWTGWAIFWLITAANLFLLRTLA